MPRMPTINLMRPIARVRVIDAAQNAGRAVHTQNHAPEKRGHSTFSPPDLPGGAPPHEKVECPLFSAGDDAIGHPLSSDGLPSVRAGLKPAPTQGAELARLVTVVNNLADRLGRVYEETLACNRGQIARLAVEIARKILMYKVDQGDYAIQAIVEEALKQAPTRQKVVVRLNPEDLPGCQRLQREAPQRPFAELELAPDGSLGRGECLVQTPKGIVTSFLEQHLERIREALEKAE